MRTKCKDTSPPSGGKQLQKGKQLKKNDIPSLTEDDEIERSNPGKTIIDKENEEKSLGSSKMNLHLWIQGPKIIT